MIGPLYTVIYILPSLAFIIAAASAMKKHGKWILDRLMFWASIALFVLAIVLAYTVGEPPVTRTFVFAGISYLVVSGVAWVYGLLSDPQLRKQ